MPVILKKRAFSYFIISKIFNFKFCLLIYVSPVTSDEDVPTMVKPNKKFRHWDHKFEWTRKEFQDWCQNDILNEYADYELVKFDGLGEAPTEYANVGFCTQIAIFVQTHARSEAPSLFETYLEKKKKTYLRNHPLKSSESGKTEQDAFFLASSFKETVDQDDFRLISAIMYPFENFDFETESERQSALLREIDSTITFLTASYRGFGAASSSNSDSNALSVLDSEKLANNIDLDDENTRLVSLDKLFEFPSLKKLKYDNEKMLEIMKENDYEFTASQKYVIFRVVDEPYSEENEENDEATENPDCYSSHQFNEEEEEWA